MPTRYLEPIIIAPMHAPCGTRIEFKSFPERIFTHGHAGMELYVCS